jgi:CCR4-NOT complex subunit CAF16
MAPYDVLLLDEVTVDLDVLVREELLQFLKRDSETRGATIICTYPWFVLYLTLTVDVDATHIFDGLNNFPTHVAHMSFGRLVTPPSPWPIPSDSVLHAQFGSSTLYNVALQWFVVHLLWRIQELTPPRLKEDREYRRELEKNGRKVRGAIRDQVVS